MCHVTPPLVRHKDKDRMKRRFEDRWVHIMMVSVALALMAFFIVGWVMADLVRAAAPAPLIELNKEVYRD